MQKSFFQRMSDKPPKKRHSNEQIQTNLDIKCFVNAVKFPFSEGAHPKVVESIVQRVTLKKFKFIENYMKSECLYKNTGSVGGHCYSK
jgi:hypothetical protein